MRHLLKSLIRSRWEPVVVLMKTHWIGRKPPLPSHWGGVWGAELWRRRLDFTSQLPGPRGHQVILTTLPAGQPDSRTAGQKVLTAPQPAALPRPVQLHPILIHTPTLPPAGITLNLFKES